MLPAGAGCGRAASARSIGCARHRTGSVRRASARGTWFERSLAEHGVDLVWFATNYAEDCDQPFIFTVFDVEHARQPWFPEVSANGEWEQRHHYFSRYIPKATRVIVPNEAGPRAGGALLAHRGRPRSCCSVTPRPSSRSRPALSRAAARRARPARASVSATCSTQPSSGRIRTTRRSSRRCGCSAASYELVCVGSDKGQLDHHRRLAADARGGGARALPRLCADRRPRGALPPRARAHLREPVRPREPASARGDGAWLPRRGGRRARRARADGRRRAAGARRSTRRRSRTRCGSWTTRQSANGWWLRGASAPPASPRRDTSAASSTSWTISSGYGGAWA